MKLPDVLVNPPWFPRRNVLPDPAEFADLELADRPEFILWQDDAREQSLVDVEHLRDTSDLDENAAYERLVRWAALFPGGEDWEFADPGTLLAFQDDEKALDVFGRVPGDMWDPQVLSRLDFDLFLARFGIDCIPALVKIAQAHPTQCLRHLATRIDSPRLAPAMAYAFYRVVGTDESARRWMRRFPETAAFGLIPDALGGQPLAREAALAALEEMIRMQLSDAVLEATRHYEARVRSAVREFVVAKPASDPDEPPQLPEFWRPEDFTPVRMKNGIVVPLENLNYFGGLLMRHPFEARTALKHFDPTSLREFAWDLFEAYRYSAKKLGHEWVIGLLGDVGDDETARRIYESLDDPDISGLTAVALRGTLADIGTEYSIMLLADLAPAGRPANKSARYHLSTLARKRRLTVEELVDRSIPNFGVGFDGSIPASTADDPPVDAMVRHVEQVQARRFERAMCTRREWRPADFARYVVGHSIVCPIAQSIVWWARIDDRFTAFRIDESLGLTDSADEPIRLTEDARIFVAHPVLLEPDEVTAWTELFADYDVIQPFDQLSRPVARQRSDEAPWKQWSGASIARERLSRLEDLGWSPSARTTYRVRAYDRQLDAGALVFLGFGGVDAPNPTRPTRGAAHVDSIEVSDALHRTPLSARSMDHITYSEVVTTIDVAMNLVGARCS